MTCSGQWPAVAHTAVGIWRVVCALRCVALRVAYGKWRMVRGNLAHGNLAYVDMT